MPTNESKTQQMNLAQKNCAAETVRVHVIEAREVSVIPFLRSGYFVRFEPRLTPEEIDRLLEQIKTGWKETREAYLARLSGATGIDLSRIGVRDADDVVLRVHGESKIADLPLVAVPSDGSGDENRVCVALCTGEGDSKLLSRMGVVVARQEGSVRGIPFDQLNIRLRTFRSVNAALLDFFLGRVTGMLDNPGRVRKTGEFEASVVGVRDEEIKDFFERLVNSEALLRDIVRERSPEEIRKVYSYFQGIEQTATSIPECLKSRKLTWFSSPFSVVTETGYSQPREVLFAASDYKNGTRVSGIAYDDSADGELAHLAANEISLMFAKE